VIPALDKNNNTIDRSLENNMILDQIENEDFRTSLNPEDLWLFDQLKELYGEKVG